MSVDQLSDFAMRVHCLIHQLIRNYEVCDRMCLTQYGVTASQGYTVLSLPAEGDISMNELSRNMGVDSSTMTRMVDQLIQKGLVHRKCDDRDRRLVRVELTAQGRQLQQDLEKALHHCYGEILGTIQENERATVIRSLEQLNEVIAKAAACGAGL